MQLSFDEFTLGFKMRGFISKNSWLSLLQVLRVRTIRHL